MGITIGLAIVIHNGSARLPSSIAQFYHVADDILVINDGSDNNIVEVTTQFGARVLSNPFAGDFSAQKNFAIENLDTDWIYIHESDELLEPTLISLIPSLVTQTGQKEVEDLGLLPETTNPFDCFGFPRRNMIDGEQHKDYPDYQYRLFRNYCRFQGKVREQVVNFKNKIELDAKRNTLESPSRFHILRYLSSTQLEYLEDLYDSIEERN